MDFCRQTISLCARIRFLAFVGTMLLAAITSTRAETPTKIETDEKVLRERLVGSWKILSASFNGKPSKLHAESVTIKHITPVHIIWIGYQPEQRQIFRSSGGSWTIRDGKYSETMRYGIGENFREKSFGKSFSFDCRFEGNKWIQSGTMPDGTVLEEIWQRIEPDEDVSAWPSK
jgi:hypothetical protein